MPFPNHYNTLLKDPYFIFQKQSQGYYLYDGLPDDDQIQLLDARKVENVKPYIAIYKLYEL